jgi:hypothetical protein
MAKQSKSEKLRELIESSRGEVTKFASDVLAELYQGLLKLPAITLPDGTTASVEAYYPPQVDEAGECHCGIDVRLSSGDLLEFTLKNTGWEKSFVGDLVEKQQQRSRENRQR